MTLLARAAAGPLDELRPCQAASACTARSHWICGAPQTRCRCLLDAAKQLEPLDVPLARDAYLEALRAASVAGRLGPGMLDAARAALAAPRAPGEPRAVDLLVDGLAVRFTDGYAASAPALKRRTRRASRRGPVGRGERPLAVVRATRGAGAVRRRHLALPRRTRRSAGARERRARGAPTRAQHPRAGALLGGRPRRRGRAARRGRCHRGRDRRRTRAHRTAVAGRLLAGSKREALVVFEATERGAIARGEGVVLTLSEHARAVLYNGLGRYDAALEPAQSAGERDELYVSAVVVARARGGRGALRPGRRGERRESSACRSGRARRAPTWRSGIEARSRALLSEGAAR